MSALPDARWSTPPDAIRPAEGQLEARAAEVLAYWMDGPESYSMFGYVAGELFDTDETTDELYRLHVEGNTAELGAELSRMVRDALAVKAAQYAEDEFNGDLLPHQTLRRVPEGYISPKHALANRAKR